MNRTPALLSVLIIAATATRLFAQAQTPPVAQAQAPDPDGYYHLGPDSLPQEGVPKGEIRGPFTLPSQEIGRAHV